MTDKARAMLGGVGGATAILGFAHASVLPADAAMPWDIVFTLGLAAVVVAVLRLA